MAGKSHSPILTLDDAVRERRALETRAEEIAAFMRECRKEQMRLGTGDEEAQCVAAAWHLVELGADRARADLLVLAEQLGDLCKVLALDYAKRNPDAPTAPAEPATEPPLPGAVVSDRVPLTFPFFLAPERRRRRPDALPSKVTITVVPVLDAESPQT